MSDTRRINASFGFSRSTVANPFPINRDDPGGEITLNLVRSESSVEAISDESFRYSRRFPTSANGNQAIFGIANGRKGDLKRSSHLLFRVKTKVPFGTSTLLSCMP
ncbi:unnamed protein product [Prunus armeniaca]